MVQCVLFAYMHVNVVTFHLVFHINNVVTHACYYSCTTTDYHVTPHTDSLRMAVGRAKFRVILASQQPTACEL